MSKRITSLTDVTEVVVSGCAGSFIDISRDDLKEILAHLVPEIVAKVQCTIPLMDDEAAQLWAGTLTKRIELSVEEIRPRQRSDPHDYA